jgi:hypothetical protein
MILYYTHSYVLVCTENGEYQIQVYNSNFQFKNTIPLADCPDDSHLILNDKTSYILNKKTMKLSKYD